MNTDNGLPFLGVSIAWSLNGAWLFDLSLNRKQIYTLRDQSGLSPREFYRQYFGHNDQRFECLEVDGMTRAPTLGKHDH